MFNRGILVMKRVIIIIKLVQKDEGIPVYVYTKNCAIIDELTDIVINLVVCCY